MRLCISSILQLCLVVLVSDLPLQVGAFSIGQVAQSSSSPTRLCMSERATAESTSTAEKKRRVVVTGLGVVSGCGVGVEPFFQAVCAGESSIRKVQRFDVQHYPCQIASEVPEEMFSPNDHFVNAKNAKSNDRYTHFAVAAARLALKDAKLGDTPETLHNPDRIGVMVGTAFGGMETVEQETLKLHQKPERPKVRIDSKSSIAKWAHRDCFCMHHARVDTSLTCTLVIPLL
jgi:Beta-ketoacyl synthase, N-terminal domain